MSFMFQQPFVANPKVRQEGFHLPNVNGTSSSGQSPSPPANGAFDSNAMFFNQPMFPDAFRKFNEPNSMDFTDELASLIAAPSAPERSRSGHSPSPFDQTTDWNTQQRAPPHDIFGVSHQPQPAFPNHFSLPPSRAIPRDDVPSQPASLHAPTTTHRNDFFFTEHARNVSDFNTYSAAMQQARAQAQQEAAAAAQQQQAESHAHSIQPGRQSPSSGVSRSRSRSKAPQRQTSRLGRKRASISSPSPPPGARPQAIVIPSTQPTSYPMSPLSMHTPVHAQTPPAWFIPSHTPADSTSGFSIPTPESIAAQSFGHQAFGQPLGQSPKSNKDSPPPQDAAAKQAAIANEKRRRRRESHNAVERRRRDNINEKISELATLIPECMLDPSAKPGDGIDGLLNGGGALGEEADGKEPAAIKANKGMILRKSVEYIRYLQQLVTAQATRNRDLESQLSQLRPEGGLGTGLSGALTFPPEEGDEGMSGLILASLSPDQDFGFGQTNGVGMGRKGTDTSPSAAGSMEDDEEEEERGRGREKRKVGFGGLATSIEVKEEDESHGLKPMET